MAEIIGEGLDEAWDRLTILQLKTAGYRFVCRYLGEDTTGKNLTMQEADELKAAGIAIVSNYEYAPGAALAGYPRGYDNAQLARRQHAMCGGPDTAPIYFSVDVDVADSVQMAAVVAYFRGVNAVLGVARTGAYAEYDVIKQLFDAGVIRYGWQTYAWSHGQWDPRAQLRQVRNGLVVAGHDVDEDQALTADFGQWGAQIMDGFTDDDRRLLTNVERACTAVLVNGERQVWGLDYTPGAYQHAPGDPSRDAQLWAVLDSIATRPQVTVDAAAVAAAIVADPGFPAALQAALRGLRLNVAEQ